MCTQKSGQCDICDMNRAQGRNGVAMCDLCVKLSADAVAAAAVATATAQP
jgi:hypothetical protein